LCVQEYFLKMTKTQKLLKRIELKIDFIFYNALHQRLIAECSAAIC
jgi:hypothetical protein